MVVLCLVKIFFSQRSLLSRFEIDTCMYARVRISLCSLGRRSNYDDVLIIGTVPRRFSYERVLDETPRREHLAIGGRRTFVVGVRPGRFCSPRARAVFCPDDPSPRRARHLYFIADRNSDRVQNTAIIFNNN